MATRAQMDATYNYMDEICRLSLGEMTDITCAWYDGDFSKTLAQAQHDKHEFVLNSINFRLGSRLLDIGCGWGPILNAARNRGGHGVGITLSASQAESCRRNGLDVHLKDWKDLSVETFGRFDGLVSIGAFEHFCSMEEYEAGKQDEIYRRFFALCHDSLPPGGRLYLQTMMWGRNFHGKDNVSINAARGSTERILAVLGKFYPGSWLPYGEEHIIRVAAPYFRICSLNNGRLDYIQTLDQFNVVWKFSFRKLIPAMKLVPCLVRDEDFRYKVESLRGGYNKECFKREVMDHQRMIFERVEAA